MTEYNSALLAKVSGFVPGVDMVDGRCDIETAHYFVQIFADGDVYTVGWRSTCNILG